MVRRLSLFPKVSGKASHTRLAIGARLRLAVPATAFCSWMISGTPDKRAARPPGPVT
ncbi:hypothetical protein D3C76_1867180 [compost metagenome]